MVRFRRSGRDPSVGAPPAAGFRSLKTTEGREVREVGEEVGSPDGQRSKNAVRASAVADIYIYIFV